MSRRHALIVAAAVAAANVTAAGASSASRWTPPALATDQYESSPTFSPDGREMLLFRGDPSFRHYRLLYSRCVDGHWSAGVTPDFAAPPPVDEADPAFTVDGLGLYFVSSRGGIDLDIWFVDRDAHGNWGKPERLPAPVNSTSAELLPRPQPDGSLVFGSDRAGGLGGNDIYVARRDGNAWRVENAGAPVNTAADEYEADISRDGRLMIVVADRGDRSHLYPYRRVDGDWVPQPRIVPRLDVFQVGPLLSPNGNRLLFAQADGALSGELFVIDLTPVAGERWPPGCRPSGPQIPTSPSG